MRPAFFGGEPFKRLIQNLWGFRGPLAVCDRRIGPFGVALFPAQIGTSRTGDARGATRRVRFRFTFRRLSSRAVAGAARGKSLAPQGFPCRKRRPRRRRRYFPQISKSARGHFSKRRADKAGPGTYFAMRKAKARRQGCASRPGSNAFLSARVSEESRPGTFLCAGPAG